MKRFFVVVIAAALGCGSASAGKKNQQSSGNAQPSSGRSSGNAGGGYRSSGNFRGYSARYQNLNGAAFRQQNWSNRFNNVVSSSHVLQQQHRLNNSALSYNRLANASRGLHQNVRGTNAHHGNWDTIRNWKGNRGSFADACHRHHREWHDCNWWRNHYTVVFISTGWYFWDAGWWYPAWGYDPYYEYGYDAPLYSAYDGSPVQNYDNSDVAAATPEPNEYGNSGGGDYASREVVMRVQTELKRSGYYYGDIDGDLGPVTRAAIANYQRDHHLAVNASIDAATLRQIGGSRVASSLSEY